MKAQKIPHIDSIDELARFWDKHDLTEFGAELEEVKEPIFERKTGTFVRIRLQPQEMRAVQRLANARGVEQAAMLREWVREKLRESAPKSRLQRSRRQAARH
jgi:hypothetical protein